MARHISAERQARKALKHRSRNKAYKSRMNTAVKKVRIAKGKDEAAAALVKINKLLDQLAAKGIIHRNNAANKKSRLTKFVNSMK
ncbi:MAG TPA: 30S ribosomal protein S20 [Bacteroidota bacterium]|nr:30S ribosomal protein S20 [Bacteroidota bacterium]